VTAKAGEHLGKNLLVKAVTIFYFSEKDAFRSPFTFTFFFVLVSPHSLTQIHHSLITALIGNPNDGYYEWIGLVTSTEKNMMAVIGLVRLAAIDSKFNIVSNNRFLMLLNKLNRRI